MDRLVDHNYFGKAGGGLQTQMHLKQLDLAD